MMKNEYLAVNTLVDVININLKSIYVTHAEKDDVYKFKTKGNLYYCYVLVVKGKMTLMTKDSHTIDVKSSHAVFLWENDIQSYSFSEDTKYYWVYFSLIGNTLVLLKPFSVDGEKVAMSLQKCLKLINRSTLIELCRANTIFIKSVLDGVEKLIEEESNNKSVHRRAIELSIDYIKDNLYNLPSVQDIASLFGLSLKQYRKYFKKIVGEFPAKYIADQKILLVRDCLLNTDLTVNQIAEMLNFSSPYYLSSSFKKVFNCSPKEYRNKHRE